MDSNVTLFASQQKSQEVRFIYSVRTNANTIGTSQQGKYFSILHITDSVSADIW